MRISDWSSDVCSSDLVGGAAAAFGGSEVKARRQVLQRAVVELATVLEPARRHPVLRNLAPADRERPLLQPPLEKHAAVLLQGFGDIVARQARRDRKSTRLNSSH